MSEDRNKSLDEIDVNVEHINRPRHDTAFRLIDGIREGKRLDAVKSNILWSRVRRLVESKYSLPASMKIYTEAGTSATTVTTTRTIVIYILDNHQVLAYAPPTTVVSTKTGRSVKHTGVGSPILTPSNVVAMLVVKVTNGRNTETKKEIKKLKVIQYGEYDDSLIHDNYWSAGVDAPAGYEISNKKHLIK